MQRVQAIDWLRQQVEQKRGIVILDRPARISLASRLPRRARRIVRVSFIAAPLALA